MTEIIENQRSNFNPNVWGPKAWFFLDTIVLSYPIKPSDQDKQNYTNFFYDISAMLPCEGCRNNYTNHFNSLILTDKVLETRDNLIDWWLKIHNMARATMNKNNITYDEFIRFYQKSYSICDDNRDMIRNIIYICLFFIIILWCKDFIFKNKKI